MHSFQEHFFHKSILKTSVAIALIKDSKYFCCLNSVNKYLLGQLSMLEGNSISPLQLALVGCFGGNKQKETLQLLLIVIQNRCSVLCDKTKNISLC